MTRKRLAATDALAPPSIRLSVGVTGHRDNNPAFFAHRARIAAVLAAIFDAIDAAVAGHPAIVEPRLIARTRLHTLLAYGADLLSVELALARNWEVVTPLPVGLDLNVAINAQPAHAGELRALLTGSADCSSAARVRADHMRALAARVRLFELAEQDAAIETLLRRHFEALQNANASEAFVMAISERAATAARVMIEQSDIVIGIWDGATRAAVGGTGHTIAAALEQGAPVIWVDAAAPEQWRILRAQETLAVPAPAAGDPADRDAELRQVVAQALRPVATQLHAHVSALVDAGVARLRGERWRPRSNRLFHSYRRIETLFGGEPGDRRFRSLTQRYEAPEAIGTGSGAELLATARALPAADLAFADAIETAILRRFAWADGLSTFLSDAYRGGMVTNFLLSACAIVGGIAYLPLASDGKKWLFALLEFVLLSTVLAIIGFGRAHRWHNRWFETRRVAEYFRHAPILLLLGVARSPGRWPRGSETSWPEWYARHALRELGLPRIAVTTGYLREALGSLLRRHVVRQRDYHLAKARRLTAAHHRLDKVCEALFVLAVVSVAGYLVLKAGGALALLPAHLASDTSAVFTFLGVLFPTLGGALAGIRYFGDFERFAAISRVTANKLDAIEQRIRILLAVPTAELRFSQVADLAHAVDDVVVTEIENWQAVFGGKHLTLPV